MGPEESEPTGGSSGARVCCPSAVTQLVTRSPCSGASWQGWSAGCVQGCSGAGLAGCCPRPEAAAMGRGENNACPDFSSADLSTQLVARWKPEVQGMGMWGLGDRQAI